MLDISPGNGVLRFFALFECLHHRIITFFTPYNSKHTHRFINTSKHQNTATQNHKDKNTYDKESAIGNFLGTGLSYQGNVLSVKLLRFLICPH